MKRIVFGEKIKEKIVLSLGFFDSLHKGHRALIESGRTLSKKLNAKNAVFTFYSEIPLKKGLLYSFDERMELLSFLCDFVLTFPFNEKSKNISPVNFLESLIGSYDIVGIVSGKDFTFGKGGQGDISLLKDFCSKKGITQIIVDEVVDSEGKISTSRIIEKIKEGNIERANELLVDDYIFIGKVESGRKVGRKLGFPTVNAVFPANKEKLKSGVYYATCYIEGKEYKCAVNVGSAPTFNESEYKVEAHILDFDGEFYGENITLRFKKRIRDVVNFVDLDKLTKQIEKDVNLIKEL